MLSSSSNISKNGLFAYDTVARLTDDLLGKIDQDRSHALLLIDHDSLDAINATYGRWVGDSIIEHTSETLPAIFRATDLVARGDDDEFIVLMKDISSLDTIECIAGLLLQLLRYPCSDEQSHYAESTVTIGIALSKGPQPHTFARLVANARAALAEAKLSNEYRFVIYDPYKHRVRGSYGFTRLVNSVMPNMQPFLDTIDNGGVLLRAEPGEKLVPQFFSNSFLALLGGMSREEALRVYGSDILAGLHERDQERVREELEEAIATNDSLRTIARMQSVDGEYVWVSIFMTWTRDSHGRIDAFSAHTSIDSLLTKYDFTTGNASGTPVTDGADFTFIQRFSDGKPSRFSLFKKNGNLLPHLEGTSMTEVLLSGNFIHKDSQKALKAFCADMEQGVHTPGTIFLCHDPETQDLKWMRFSYLIMNDEDGNPVQAVGGIREMPHAPNEESRYKHEKEIFNTIASRMLSVSRVDLTTGKALESHPGTLFEEDMTYDVFLNEYINTFCYPDDALAVMNTFSRDSLLSAFGDGMSRVSLQFRREQSGQIRWTNTIVHIIEEPQKRHLIAFFYCSDVEMRHDEVALASSLALTEYDKTTGFYSKESLAHVVGSMQHIETANTSTAAIAVVRVAVPSDFRSLLTAHDANLERTYLGQHLALCLGLECLIACYHHNGYILFFPHVDSEEWVRHHIKDAITNIHDAYQRVGKNNYELVLACGFTIDSLRNLRFNEAVMQADSACMANRAEMTGSVWSFDEYSNLLQAPEDPSKEHALRTVERKELERPLFGDEREAADEAMRGIILAEDFDSASKAVLHVLGTFYQARRTFTIALLKNNVLTGLQEWCDVGVQPIIGQIVGRRLSDFAAMQESDKVRKPLIVAPHITTRRPKSLEQSAHQWGLIIYPVVKEGLVAGFVCVECPKQHKDDIALLHEIVPLLAHVREKELNAPDINPKKVLDRLTGLPNSASFERDSYTFNPTLFHSVGVVRIGLESVYTMEGILDESATDSLVLYAARNLCGLFPLDATYRTGDNELTCICTNMSYESFNARCSRVSTILSQRTPHGFALCDAWSDRMLSLGKLLEMAASSVYGERSLLFPDTESDSKLYHSKDSDETPSFDGDAFSIRLQPLVDLETGKVVGAEALARCTTPDGSLVMPSEFVPRLESEGLVSDLDYFVFEKALSTLTEWIDEGFPPSTCRSISHDKPFRRQALSHPYWLLPAAMTCLSI